MKFKKNYTNFHYYLYQNYGIRNLKEKKNSENLKIKIIKRCTLKTKSILKG